MIEGNHRYNELDALRGLAALSVLFGHLYLLFHETILSKLLFEYGLFRALIAGSEAVTLFFVLSGFVLALPYYSNKQLNYGSYAIRRICRIYIPYLASIVIAFLARQTFYSGKMDGQSNWFNMNWSSTLDVGSIIDHLVLVGTFNSNLNNVVWSLVHEMRISLVFPLLIYALVKVSLKSGIGLSVIFSAISVIYVLFSGRNFVGTEFYATVHYTAMFMIGALLAKNREKLIHQVTKLTLKFKTGVFLMGFILYLYAHPSFILNIVIRDLNPFFRTVIDTWFITLGASILIIFALSSTHFSNLLRTKVVQYIGKISYSLYLCHIAVLVSCIHFFNGKIPVPLICTIAVLGTFIVSSIMYHLVEKPAIRLGRFLTTPHTKRNRNRTNMRTPIMPNK
jgi:peptidoglycan/LPS O-acetylase OafA/YrhL